MSVTISTDVFCDQCGNWIEGVTGAKPRHKEARRVAKEAGWSYHPSHGYQDLCPICAADKMRAKEVPQ